jgi:dihydrodipicolinate synthase/N-acetylneuraminate lyase
VGYARQAEAVGATALMAIQPEATRLGEDGLLDYYEDQLPRISCRAK